MIFLKYIFSASASASVSAKYAKPKYTHICAHTYIHYRTYTLIKLMVSWYANGVYIIYSECGMTTSNTLICS